MRLLKQIIFYKPTANCCRKGRSVDWIGLPKSKSLFFARPGCGLPIGNLTSQLFGNVYLSDFDHFVKGRLKIRYYGRYVDDMVFAHKDKEYLKAIIPQIDGYLRKRLDLKLHDKKIYLQHYKKGVKFLNAFIKPYRVYIDKRTKINFYAKIREWNRLLDKQNNKLSLEKTENIIACANSYLGLIKHYKTKKLQYQLFNTFNIYFYNFAYIERNILRTRKFKQN